MPVVVQGRSVHRPVRARGEHRVQVSELLRDDPVGPDPKPSFTKGFFDVAAAESEAADGRDRRGRRRVLQQRLRRRARERQEASLKIVYDKAYPPATTDFAPIVRAMQATNPDLVVICSYPPDSVGMVRAVNEIGFKPKMIGGAMVGLQATAIKTQLGPLLNGWVNYDFWLPVPKMEFAGVEDFLKKYQARAAAEGVDPLGYYLGAWGYAQIEVLGAGDRRRPRASTTPSSPTTSAPDHVQDRRRRREVRQERRMGEVARAAGPVPDVKRATTSASSRHVVPDRADAGRYEDRQRDLSVREGEAVSQATPPAVVGFESAPAGRGFALRGGAIFWEPV